MEEISSIIERDCPVKRQLQAKTHEQHTRHTLKPACHCSAKSAGKSQHRQRHSCSALQKALKLNNIAQQQKSTRGVWTYPVR
jgi:hypothetical protein